MAIETREGCIDITNSRSEKRLMEFPTHKIPPEMLVNLVDTAYDRLAEEIRGQHPKEWQTPLTMDLAQFLLQKDRLGILVGRIREKFVKSQTAEIPQLHSESEIRNKRAEALGILIFLNTIHNHAEEGRNGSNDRECDPNFQERRATLIRTYNAVAEVHTGRKRIYEGKGSPYSVYRSQGPEHTLPSRKPKLPDLSQLRLRMAMRQEELDRIQDEYLTLLRKYHEKRNIPKMFRSLVEQYHTLKSQQKQDTLVLKNIKDE